MKKKYTRSRKQPVNVLKTLIFLAITVVGVLATTFLVQRQTFDVSRASEALPPALSENNVGTAQKAATVVTENVIDAEGATLYVASVTMKPYREVSSISGLGLEWKKSVAQCGARSQTGVEMWTAEGTPTTSEKVTATFAAAPENAVISVSAFSDVSTDGAVVGALGFNTLGNSGACSGGSDSKAYMSEIDVSENTMVFGAVATRLRTHSAGESFAELLDLQFGSSDGDKAGLALVSKESASAGTVKIAGTLDGDTDWATAAIVIKGKEAVVVPTATPDTSGPTVPAGTPKSEEVVSGTATRVNTISSAPIQKGSNQLYLATVANYQNKAVTSVSGLGLAWNKVVDQCGARNATGTQMWYAVGSPSSNGAVTATFDTRTEAASIIVTRYSGVNMAAPFVNAHGENTAGESGACTGGSESKTAKITMNPTLSNALVVSAVNSRTRGVKTAPDGYEERKLAKVGSGGAATHLYLYESALTSTARQQLAFGLSGDADWGAAGLILQPGTGGVATGPTPTPVATPTPVPTPIPTPTATPLPTVIPTATPVPTPIPTATPVPTAAPTGTPVPTATPVPTPLPTTAPSTGIGIWVSRSEIMQRPTSGAEWEAVYSTASRSWGNAEVWYQDSNHDNYVMAGAIVCVRTGEFCDKTRDGILSAIGTEIDPKTGKPSRWLAIGRNVLGYTIAADIMNLRADGNNNSAGTKINNWLSEFLTREMPDNNTGVPEKLQAFESGSNASAQEGAVMAAIAAYNKDRARLEYVWNRYRLYSCDRSPNPEKIIDLKAGLEKNWAHDRNNPCAVAPKGASKMVPITEDGGGSIRRMDGAIMNDMRRGGFYKWEPGYTPYPWVGQEGYTPVTLILARQGYPAFELSDKALLRTYEYLWYVKEGTGNIEWFDGSRGKEGTHLVNKYYGTNFPAKYPIGVGRTYGFTGYTHPTKESMFR